MTYLDRMLQLVDPPEAPDLMNKSWEELEQEMAVSFPEDFKMIISLYGAGVFEPSGLNLICYGYKHEKLEYTLPKLSHHFYMSHNFQELNVFQDGCGLLPFAGITAETTFLWDVSSQVDLWPVVCARDGGGRIDYISKGGLTATEFFLRVFQGNDDDNLYYDSIDRLKTLGDSFCTQRFERMSDLLQKSLYNAVRRKDHLGAQDMVRRGVDVNTEFGEEGTALDIAAELQSRELAKVLIANGAISHRQRTQEFMATLEEPS